jgi:hypothetical protein
MQNAVGHGTSHECGEDWSGQQKYERGETEETFQSNSHADDTRPRYLLFSYVWIGKGSEALLVKNP